MTDAYLAGDVSGALSMHNQLTQLSWSSHRNWLTALKWLIQFKAS
jgi:hypothetical protein